MDTVLPEPRVIVFGKANQSTFSSLCWESVPTPGNLSSSLRLVPFRQVSNEDIRARWVPTAGCRNAGIIVIAARHNNWSISIGCIRRADQTLPTIAPDPMAGRVR